MCDATAPARRYATLFGLVVLMRTVFLPVLCMPCIKMGDKTLREWVGPAPPSDTRARGCGRARAQPRSRTE